MFQVNVYVINFYSTTGCKKTFNYVKKEIKTKNQFSNKTQNVLFKNDLFSLPKQIFTEEPCFYKIFNFSLPAVEICFIRSWPALLLIHSRKEHWGKTQRLIYYCLFLLCILLHLWAGSVKHMNIHKTRPVQFIMQLRSMQYSYSYIKNRQQGSR